MRNHGWLLLCLAICHAHLYRTAGKATRPHVCVCCDGPGECDEVDVHALPPMVFTLHFPPEAHSTSVREDDREEINFDFSK